MPVNLIRVQSMLISLLVGIVSTEGSKRLTRRETAAVSAVTAGAAVKEDDFSPAENTTADSPDQTADVTTTNQLDQSYSVLLKSLSEAYLAMFPAHDHDEEHGHSHGHEQDDVWDVEDHDHQDLDDLGLHESGVNHEDGHEHDNDNDEAGHEQRKNRTSWLHQHLPHNHRHANHHHHHEDKDVHEEHHHDHPVGHHDKDQHIHHEHRGDNHGHHHGHHGQSDGPITATTWLAALACMLVISLMGLLAVGCLPLLQGPRFESSSLCS